MNEERQKAWVALKKHLREGGDLKELEAALIMTDIEEWHRNFVRQQEEKGTWRTRPALL